MCAYHFINRLIFIIVVVVVIVILIVIFIAGVCHSHKLVVQ